MIFVWYNIVRYSTVLGVPEHTKSGTVSYCTESSRIGTVSITNDILGGDNVLGKTFASVKSLSSERVYFGLILWVAVTVFSEK